MIGRKGGRSWEEKLNAVSDSKDKLENFILGDEQLVKLMQESVENFFMLLFHVQEDTFKFWCFSQLNLLIASNTEHDNLWGFGHVSITPILCRCTTRWFFRRIDLKIYRQHVNADV